MKPPATLICPPGTAKVGNACHRLPDTTPCNYNVPGVPASGCVFTLNKPTPERCAPGNGIEPSAACALTIQPTTPVDQLPPASCMLDGWGFFFAVLAALACP